MSIVLASVYLYAESIFIFAFLCLFIFTIYKMFKNNLPTFGIILGSFLFMMSFFISALAITITHTYDTLYFVIDTLALLVLLAAVLVLAYNLHRRKHV